MKVLIVTVPMQAPTSPPPILSILAACCEQVGADYDVFDLNLHMYKTLDDDQIHKLNTDFTFNCFDNNQNQDLYTKICEKLVDRIEQYQPDIVAISVFTIQSVLATSHLLDILKAHPARQNYKIVIGGIGVTDQVSNITGNSDFGTWARENQLVEYCITGEGEFSFPELLRGNMTYPGINGIPSIQIQDLDLIPPPSYEKIDPKIYLIDTAPEISITGSKGCVRDCTFCDVAHYWKKYTYRSGNLIADDIYNIFKKTGVRNFNFTDSLINGSLKSFRQLNRRLIELNQQDPDFKISYTGQFICRPIGQMTERDYVEMKQAGAHVLAVGIEHFSESVRTHMRKHFNNDAIDWHFAKCAELGIENMLLLVSGYVTETLDDHKINLEYLHRYQRYALTQTIVSVSAVAGGQWIDQKATVYNMKEELDLRISSEDRWQWISGANPDLTPRERIRRSTELLYTAGKLNYPIELLAETVMMLKRMHKSLEKSSAKKVFSILEKK